jgi:hypothetical protein
LIEIWIPTVEVLSTVMPGNRFQMPIGHGHWFSAREAIAAFIFSFRGGGFSSNSII